MKKPLVRTCYYNPNVLVSCPINPLTFDVILNEVKNLEPEKTPVSLLGRLILRDTSTSSGIESRENTPVFPDEDALSLPLADIITPAQKGIQTIQDSQTYRLGARDVVTVKVWGEENLSGDYPVDENGSITLPLAGEVPAQGKSAGELKEILTGRWKKYILMPMVSVSVKEYNSQKVYVFGEVTSKSEVYKLSGPITILECLVSLGGFTKDSDMNNVTIQKASGEVKKVDFSRIIFKNDTAENVLLEAGDMVYVPFLKKEPLPEEKKILVLGEVRSSGVYRFKQLPRLSEVVAMAGGFTEEAIFSDIKVIRGNLNKPEVLSVKFSDFLKKGIMENDVLLAENDIVFVPKTFMGNINAFLKQILPTVQVLGWASALSQ